ncbi:uncharacterized protein LOC142804399 isoform X2 [Rhipicephalus microplus]|uniref:uncharacterized protein LOC142804399 isoform X2 n=1 Tax=Rhipicephalus microplus TaxID=6941 RepID=UPI003F6CB687
MKAAASFMRTKTAKMLQDFCRHPEGIPNQQPQKKGVSQNGSVHVCSCKPSQSRTHATRLSATPSSSPQMRRTDRLVSTTSLRSSGTTPDSSPRMLRKNAPSYSRTITKTLPQLPHSGRCRSFGMGPFTTVYRNRFGTFTRITSSPPTRPRLLVSSSPILLRGTATRSTFTKGRTNTRNPPNPMRLYHIACATASSAAKQRPPVRPRLPPPPVPPLPPPPPPLRPRPTFASPTQSSVAKQVVPVNKYASHSAASTRAGSPVQHQTYGSGRLSSSNRQSCRASSLSLTSLSSKARHLPRSPAPSPTPVKRSETFTRKSAGPAAAASSADLATSAEAERQVPTTTRTKLTRSRTFSKEDRVEIVKRDSSPRVFKPKSPSPAQSPERTTSKTPPVTTKLVPPATSQAEAAASISRSPPSVGATQMAIKSRGSKTSSRVMASTGTSSERLVSLTQPRDGNNDDEECEINGAPIADGDLRVVVVANGSLRRSSKPTPTKVTSDRGTETVQDSTASSKTSRSIMVQTTDI